MFYILRCFFTRKMSKQLTLFGRRALPKPYFKGPKTVYEKYGNRKWLDSHERLGRKQYFLVSVTKDWEVIKNDEKALAE